MARMGSLQTERMIAVPFLLETFVTLLPKPSSYRLVTRYKYNCLTFSLSLSSSYQFHLSLYLLYQSLQSVSISNGIFPRSLYTVLQSTVWALLVKWDAPALGSRQKPFLPAKRTNKDHVRLGSLPKRVIIATENHQHINF